MAVFVLLLYFYTVMVIEKKRNLAQSPRKYAILTLMFKKIVCLSPDPSACEEGDTPSTHPTALGVRRASTRLAPPLSTLTPQLQLFQLI